MAAPRGGKEERGMKARGMKGADRCPRCGSRAIAKGGQEITSFYAKTLAVCRNCGTSWEPFDPADLLDRDDPHSSFKEPCDNCAFRPGSVERQDTEEWKKTMASLKAGSTFYCHKGLPMTPGKGHGFEYPLGKPRRLRLCRGYLNMLRRQLDKAKESA